MALPAILLWPLVSGLVTQAIALVGRVGVVRLLAGGALTGEIVSQVATGDPGMLAREAEKVAARVFEYRTGIILYEHDPFSGESLGSAVTQRTGVPIRNLFDKEGIRYDLEAFALDQFSVKTGYALRSLTDKEKIKADVIGIGITILEEQVGFPLSAILTDEDPRQAMIEYFTPMVIDRITKEVEERDITAQSLIVAIQAKTGMKFTSRQISKAINSKLIQESLQYIARKRKQGMITRRTLQNRAAQTRFRAKHGSRAQYVPIGMPKL